MKGRPILRLMQSRAFNCTVKNAMKRWALVLKQADVPEAKESTMIFMAHILKKKQFSEVLQCSNYLLSAQQYSEFKQFCSQRLQRMPVQYIIGEWDFLDMTLKVEPPIFIPRPETEQLASLAIERVANLTTKVQEPTVLEVGCGTGAITLSILKAHKHVKCVAIDKNPKACALTEYNAKQLGLTNNLEVVHATISKDGIDRTLPYTKFDLIVSNPPYIPTPQICTLEPEVRRYEDVSAYDGGEDGLDTVKFLIEFGDVALSSYGCLLLEHALEHPDMLRQHFKRDVRFKPFVFHKDFTGRIRFVEISKNVNDLPSTLNNSGNT